MERDDEVKGIANSYDFGARVHDPRLGKFLSVDPKFKDYAWHSTYTYAANNPIYMVDENGEGPIDWLKLTGQKLGNLFSGNGFHTNASVQKAASQELHITYWVSKAS